MSLYVDREGDGSPLVVLHGFMGSGADWAGVRDALTAAHDCLFVDLPGHGRSTAALAAGQPADIAAMSQAVLATLEAAGLDRVDLLGYSMGGRVALYIALTHPERTGRLVLESASPGLCDPGERAARAACDDARAAELLRGGVPSFVERWYGLDLFASLRGHRAFEPMLARRRNGDAQALARVIAQMSPGRQPDLWPRLARLAGPCLLVCGGHDDKYVDIVERAAAKMPNATVAVAPDAGHNVHLERPSWFAERILHFLD